MQEATRESVAFATSQMIAQQTWLQLGVPESSVATIGSYALELPEGPAPNQMVGSLQKYEKSSGDFTAQGRDFTNEVSPEECQRAAIVDIIGLNMDRTPQNFLIGRGENGDEPPKLIAIDRLALLDPEAIAQGTRDHLASLDQVNPGLNARANLPDSAIELSKRTAILLKKAAPELSPGEVMIAISKFAPELANFDLDAEELAQRIIDEQKPLGAGYVLMMTASSQVR